MLGTDPVATASGSDTGVARLFVQSFVMALVLVLSSPVEPLRRSAYSPV